MDTVTALIYRAAGAPPQPGESPGVCRTCGQAAVGLPFDHWAKDTFTDHDKLLPGEIVCHACLFCFEEASPALTARLGRDKLQRMRNYSHFVVDGEWRPLSKAEKRQMVALLRKEPEAAVIAVSGQKHIIFRARPGWWQIEEKGAPSFPGVLWPLLEVVEQLYNGGFGKEEIETGRYTNQRRIIEFGLAEYMRLEARVAAARGTLPLQLAVFLAQKDESDGGGGVSTTIPRGAESADPPVARDSGRLQEEVRSQHLAAVRGQHPVGGLYGQPVEVRQLDLFPDADRDGGR